MTTVYGPPAMPAVPCSWDVGVTCCAEFWNTLSPDMQTAAAEYGAFILWAATGRRFGLCERTVRPCGRECTHCGSWDGLYWSEGTWHPYIFNGVWRNCICGAPGGCCTCKPDCQVWLPPPVYAIPATGISQDDTIIGVDLWRVDDGQWLVRTDGNCWPECQDFNVDSGPNTFSVTYQQGISVPAVLRGAAGELACEWAKACLGEPCRLPQRAQSISRQGVTISMVDLESLLVNGFTGIPTVDSIIRQFNPNRLTSRMRVYSPDLPAIRTTTIA